uniref:Replication factor A C-terminal domain-containing protein n=1 Tax=Brassica oleracea var. oleracea TaxID=109376 RepID=A0A0D3CR86_BRAOL
MAKKTTILTGEASSPLLFRHVSPGPGDSAMQFRLIHLWEARKNVKGGPGIILGIEMLMIDAEGFIGQSRRNQYEKELKRGSIYTLTNYYASNSKVMYHVADQRLVICISHASELTKVEEDIEGILTENFRIHSFADFEANCDLRGDLHDVFGHLKLVDGQPLHQRSVLCTKDDSASRKVMVHLQLKDGPVINVYLWDEAAENFRVKFDACAATPTITLSLTAYVLTRKLCLSSMSPSRVFLDEEVDPTKEYLTWLTMNPGATSSINSVEVVKAETLTISEIAAFIKREPAKVAYFDCIATIDDVKLGTDWYYIACKDCQKKLNRGPTTLLCPTCGNENATAVANYRVEMFVYDNEEQCTFIILGDAGKELTGRKATELIDTYVEENGGDGAELEVPLPQCFIDTIGQTKKFRIKVAPYNFTSSRQSFTATKIVSSAVLPPKKPPLEAPPGTEVENSELAESSGGGTSATDDQKKAKRIKRSG